jgi:hypothetical protein
MMTLFVVNSCADAQDPTESIDSFGALASEVNEVASLNEINGTVRGEDWYGVIYDDEVIDERLLEGIKVFLKESSADVLVLFKTNGEKGSYSPRIFRSHITLQEGSLMPEQDVRFERVLNGWIHDRN